MANKFLLISDLDDTLLGDDDALRRFSDYISSHAAQIDIAYASGRFFDSIRDDIESTSLPEPVAVIGGVGSEIRSYPAGELNEGWTAQFSGDWTAREIINILADEPELEAQPARFQSDFKVSYFFRNAGHAQLDRVKRKLAVAGIDVDIIYSSARDLDLLPVGVNKGTAAAYLAGSLGFDPSHVIVAGNSGNDISLFQHDFYGVVVANAHDDLKSSAGGPRVFISASPYADGVQEGLGRWI